MAYTTINKSTAHFNTKLYTGNGSTQSITGVGFQPDFTWIKQRLSSGYNHALFDAVRGATKVLQSNATVAERTLSDSLTAFGSDGFSLGADADGTYGNTVNQNTKSQVGWNWKAGGTASSNTDGSITSSVSANTTSGFSIVKFTGTGANATVGHGLGVAPNVIITKQLTGSTQWNFQSSMMGYSQYMALNTTVASQATGGALISSVSNTTYSCDGNSAINAGSGSTYVSYCFAEKQGYSKFGSYTGNGISDDGPFIYTGFKPAFVMFKNSSAATDWYMYDNKRGGPVAGTYGNNNKYFLRANLSNAEGNESLHLFSNGFQIRVSNSFANTNGSSYIYMAFAEAPLVGINNVPCTAR